MPLLNICATGLSDDAAHAFQSMLSIVQSRSRASWQSSAIGEADVLLAHANSDPATLERWNASGKPVVLVVDDRCSWPPARFVLRHPFRVMPLLTILDEVADHMLTRRSETLSVNEAWSLPESVRRIIGGSGDRGWFVAVAADGTQLWLSNQAARATPETIIRLHAGELQLGAFKASDAEPGSDTVALPVSDVAWRLGMQAPAELAPWLLADNSYRLRRWPDLGRLNAPTEMIELAALLAVQAYTPSQLAARSGLAIADVQHFLSASSLAGLLTNTATGAATPIGVKRVSGWMRFVGDLRRHLRLVA